MNYFSQPSELNGKLSLRDNRLIVFVSFHFLAAVIFMIETKIAKILSDCISVWHVTLL